MRKLAVFASAVLAASLAFPAVAMAAAPTKTPPPVKLKGKVNNKGTETVKNGSIDVEQDDFYFEPTFIKAKAGETIKVKLENEGNTAHTFTIDALNIDKELQPGKKATVSVKVPKSASVAFYCSFHKSSGMQGAIFTKAGTSAASSSSDKSTSTTKASSGGYGY